MAIRWPMFVNWNQSMPSLRVAKSSTDANMTLCDVALIANRTL
jgi:hypothetical protein